MSSALNKGDTSDNLWYTENYRVRTAAARHPDTGDVVGYVGYEIVNSETDVVEMFTDQLPSAVLTIQKLQKNYDEVMPDPVATFIRRESEMESRLSPLSPPGSLLQ